MQQTDKKYEFELWSIQGHRVADISHLARNRKYTLERNEAETLTFDLDFDDFSNYCRNKLNVDPKIILYPYRTDIKVKRNGVYMFGVQVIIVKGTLAVDSKTLTVQCSGYLNLFKDRYVTKSYNDIEAVQIARDLIYETQSQQYGDMGVSLQDMPYLTGIKRDRTYDKANVKQEIQRLTNLIDGNFDFSFTYDKKFNTYAKIGSLRNDVELVYPGSNITNISIERSGQSLFNKIIGLGSGFGAEQLLSVQTDATSQQTYYTRETIAQFNSVVEQATLDQNTGGVLTIDKGILEIPVININGTLFENTAFIGVGDRLPIMVKDFPYFDNIDGLYRIERMEVSLDDNDFETISIYFDNLGVDQNESA